MFDLPTIVKGKEKIINTVNSIKSQLSSNETKYLVKNKDIELVPIYEMVVEMIERGYSIKNVDINLSQIKDFIIVDNKFLIPPFSIIDGLGEAVAESIVEARKEKPFSSKEDLMNRTRISKTHFKYMEENNILDGLNEKDQKSRYHHHFRGHGAHPRLYAYGQHSCTRNVRQPVRAVHRQDGRHPARRHAGRGRPVHQERLFQPQGIVRI